MAFRNGACAGAGQPRFCLAPDKSQIYRTHSRDQSRATVHYRGCVNGACWNWISWVAFCHQLNSFHCSDPHLSKVWIPTRKSVVLTPRGWPGRASWVSPGPWQSSPAPSSSGSQQPSEEDSLPPWSCEGGIQAGRKGEVTRGQIWWPSQPCIPAHLWARWAVPKASLT